MMLGEREAPVRKTCRLGGAVVCEVWDSKPGAGSLRRHDDLA